jgi:streptogramin lyase
MLAAPRHAQEFSMRLTRPALVAVLACGPLLAAQHGLLVSGYTDAAIHLYDEHSGAPLGVVAAAHGAQSLRYGPDGFLYACAEEEDRVLKLDGATGAFVGNFVWDDPATPADESGGLDAPTAAVFGPDGALYVASFSQDRVLRFDGATGAYLGDFVAPGVGELNGPDAGMCFGPDGNLWVPSFNNNRVLRYDGATGAFLGIFVKLSDGVSRPRLLRFRGDGALWLTSWGNSRLMRFGLDGTLQATIATGLQHPTGLLIDPENGDLLVTSDLTDDVRVFDGATGVAKGTLVPANSAGLDGGTFLEYLPDREFTLARLAPGLAGASSALDLRGGTPDSYAYLLFGFAAASQQAGPCAQAWIGVQVADAFPIPLDHQGRFHADIQLPSALLGAPLHLQAVDPPTCRPSNLVIEMIQ